MSGNPLVNYSEYENHFNDISREIKDQPIHGRSCNDLCCTITFLVLTAAFIGIGIYSYTDYDSGSSFLLTEEGFSEYWDIVAIALVASLVLSFAYVFLIKMFTKVMVYTTMVLTLVVFLALAIYGIVIDQIGLTIAMGITLLLYCCILFCLRDKIKIGIVLVKLATNFMTEKPVVYVAPLFNIILTLIFGIALSLFGFWTISNLNEAQDKGEDGGKQIGFLTFYTFMWLFFTFLCYYIMTFTIAVICSHWYYNIKGNALGTAYFWIFTKQFGSLVFAAMIVAIVTFLRMLAESGRKGNKKNVAAAVCLCLVTCLLKCIQNLIKVINHFTVIMIAVTGQDFISGAKSTMGLLFEELGLLNIANLICNFLILWGMAIAAGIPLVIASFMIDSRNLSSDDTASVFTIVAILTIMVSTMIYQILVESVGCLFIFYAMDRRFMSIGLISDYKLPQETHNKLNGAYSNNPYGFTQ